MPATSKDKARLTYRDAGVDIDAGNALVSAIRPLAAKRCAKKRTLKTVTGRGREPLTRERI
jgi:phosphoribosylaminoimidazole (AIR) synthetase